MTDGDTDRRLSVTAVRLVPLAGEEAALVRPYVLAWERSARPRALVVTRLPYGTRPACAEALPSLRQLLIYPAKESCIVDPAFTVTDLRLCRQREPLQQIWNQGVENLGPEL